MSFDLFFYSCRDDIPKSKDILEYFRDTFQYISLKHKSQCGYYNDMTGVTFFINLYENDHAEYIELDKFKPFSFTGIIFSVPVICPIFVGLEIFPLIDQFIADWGLYVLNPQDLSDFTSPFRPPRAYLQSRWTRVNDALTQETNKKISLDYMNQTRSIYWWQYHYNKPLLDRELNNSIYTPELFILRGKKNKKLYLACAWSQHIPLILPKVDFLIIHKKFTRSGVPAEEIGMISYNDLVCSLGEMLADYDFRVKYLKTINPENAFKLKRKFNNLDLNINLQDFEFGISSDSFVTTRMENCIA